MKQYKIRFHDVEASLLYDKDINLATLRALALYYNVNLLLIINNRYYLIENDTINDSNELHLIQKNRYKITFEKINRNDIGQKTVGKLYMEGTEWKVVLMCARLCVCVCVCVCVNVSARACACFKIIPRPAASEHPFVCVYLM